MLTPAMLHNGQAQAVVSQRDQILEAAYRAHLERFVKGAPTAKRPPEAVWINPPFAGREESLPSKNRNGDHCPLPAL